MFPLPFLFSNFAFFRNITKQNWSYFIKKLIYFSNNDLDNELFQDGEYDEQKSLVDQTFKNLNYCKQIYENAFDDLALLFP